MDEIETGGPAFPHKIEDAWEETYTAGMTMRDYFAAKAMQGFVAADKSEEIWRDWLRDSDSMVNAYATLSYGMADAMLKAREVK